MSKQKKRKPTTVAELLKDIDDAIAKIKKEQGNDYKGCIFRGEPSDKFSEISSSLYRKLDEPDPILTDSSTSEDPIPEKYKKKMLEELQEKYARGARFQSGSTKSDTEVLAELQHYGGETNLIDFSESHLVALFFACDDDSHIGDSGRLIILPKRDIEMASDSETVPSNKRCMVSPLPNNGRAHAQRSVMLQEPNGHLEYTDERLTVIGVPQKLKSAILRHIAQESKISPETIFPDIHGYIDSQASVRRSVDSFVRIQMMLDGEEYDKARFILTLTLKMSEALGQKDPILYQLRARAYMGLGNYGEALSDFDSAIELNDKNSNLYDGRAIIYTLLKNYEKAELDFDRAIELNSKDPSLYCGRALVHMRRRDYNETLSDLECAIELDDKNSAPYGYRAGVYLVMGRYKDALNDCNNGLKLNDKEANLYMVRADIHHGQERYEDALSDINRAIELDDKKPWFYMSRAHFCYMLKRYEEALSSSNCAIELDDKNAHFYESRASALMQ